MQEDKDTSNAAVHEIFNYTCKAKEMPENHGYSNREVFTIQQVLPWDSPLSGTYTCSDGTQHPTQPEVEGMLKTTLKFRKTRKQTNNLQADPYDGIYLVITLRNQNKMA